VNRPLRRIRASADLDSFVDALKGRIRHANEYSLRTRLKLLIDELDEGVRHAFFPDGKKFVARVVEERNALNHGSDKKPARQRSTSGLHYCTHQLRVLLLVQLLRDAKIPATVYQKGLLNRYNWLRKQVHGEDQDDR
jgi:hypothetical protein